MDKQNMKDTFFENSLELIFLGLIFAAIFFQIVLGNENILSLLLRHISVAGMMFVVGYHTSKRPDTTRLLLTKGLFYVLLFLFFGFLHQVIIYNNNLFWSFTQLITLLKVPEPSDIFYTTSVIFLLGAVLNKKMYNATFKKVPLLLSCIVLLAIVFIPKTFFDYAIIGVFLGSDNYNCIPLLPFTVFYFSGYYAAKYDLGANKKHFLASAIISVGSVVLYFTPLKPIGLVTITALPIYIVFIFAKHCKWYQKLINFFFQTLEKLTWKSYHLFFDSYGKFKKTLPVYLVFYTVCFCILSLFVFSPFWASESSLIWDGDALSQYVPKAYYYMDYLHNLISGFLNGNFNIPTYDLQIGFGAPVTFNTEPLFLLLGLFPASKVESAYAFISLLRLYLAGLSASALLLYFKRNHYESLLGSLIYTFSGFALYAVVIHAQFISPMILFPLLIIATEEIFQKKRWYLCTVFVAISLLSHYYFAYMNTLAMGLYFVSRFVFTKDKDKKNMKYFLSSTGLFASSYLLGVLIGNLTLFTSFASYLESGRTEGAAASTPSLFSYGDRLPTKFLISFISPPGNTGYSSKYGFIPLVLIALIVLFMRNEKKILKFFFILYTAFCLLPFAGLVFSGFSVVINRWGFMYALLVAFITACMLPNLRNLTKRELGILFLGIIPYIALVTFNGDYLIESAPFGVIMLLVSYTVILFINENIQIINKQNTNKALLVLCIVSILVNSHLQYTIGDTKVPDNFVPRKHVLKEVKNTSLSAAEHIEDDSFYRVAPTEIETRNLNSSLVMDFNGINIFSSTVDGSFVDFNKAMDNSTWSMILYKGFDNRTFLNTLTNVKYVTTSKDFENYIPYGHKHYSDLTLDDTAYSVYENEYALPLGYTYSATVSEDELNTYSGLNKQEILLQAASVSNNNSPSKVAVNSLPTTAKEIEITDYHTGNGVTLNNNQLIVSEKDASLTLYFESLPDCETYIEYTGRGLPLLGARGHVLDFDISCNDTIGYSYVMRAKENTYTTNQNVFLYNLGYHEDSLTSCTIQFKNLGTFTFDSIKLYAQPMESYPAQINALKEDVLENVKMTSNTVTGTISLDKDKLLVMGIPYQNGWTAYVDGKETEIQKANYMFSGLFLEAGEHSIEFRYRLPGIKISLLLTGIGIVIFIAALIIRRKRMKH